MQTQNKSVDIWHPEGEEGRSVHDDANNFFRESLKLSTTLSSLYSPEDLAKIIISIDPVETQRHQQFMEDIPATKESNL